MDVLPLLAEAQVRQSTHSDLLEVALNSDIIQNHKPFFQKKSI